MAEYLTLTNIEKNYGAKEVLHAVNLSIQQGEIYVLLGKNGAGKSTLLKLISGLATPTNGMIQISGHTMTFKDKFKIGFSINQPIFYEHLTAEENLSIHCEYMDFKCSFSQIERILELVQLTPNNPTPVKNYSLGMRQRLMLARCLIHKPDLLIIDEPLNGLDPNGIRTVRTLLKNLASDGLTILMSSHILSEVEAVATNIGIISNGRLHFESKMSQLKELYGVNLEDFLIKKMEVYPHETH